MAATYDYSAANFNFSTAFFATYLQSSNLIFAVSDNTHAFQRNAIFKRIESSRLQLRMQDATGAAIANTGVVLEISGGLISTAGAVFDTISTSWAYISTISTSYIAVDSISVGILAGGVSITAINAPTVNTDVLSAGIVTGAFSLAAIIAPAGTFNTLSVGYIEAGLISVDTLSAGAIVGGIAIHDINISVATISALTGTAVTATQSISVPLAAISVISVGYITAASAILKAISVDVLSAGLITGAGGGGGPTISSFNNFSVGILDVGLLSVSTLSAGLAVVGQLSATTAVVSTVIASTISAGGLNYISSFNYTSAGIARFGQVSAPEISTTHIEAASGIFRTISVEVLSAGLITGAGGGGGPALSSFNNFSIGLLDAGFLSVSTLSTGWAVIGQISAAAAVVSTLIASTISAGGLNYISSFNYTSAGIAQFGTISAVGTSTIQLEAVSVYTQFASVGTMVAKVISADSVSAGNVNFISSFNYVSSGIAWLGNVSTQGISAVHVEAASGIFRTISVEVLSAGLITGAGGGGGAAISSFDYFSVGILDVGLLSASTISTGWIATGVASITIVSVAAIVASSLTLTAASVGVISAATAQITSLSIGTASAGIATISTASVGYLIAGSISVIGISAAQGWITALSTSSATFIANISVIASAVVTGDLDVTGNVTAFNFFATSDRRLKTDIVPVAGTEAISVIQALQGVRFTRTGIDPAPPREVGLIAQDVEAVIPELVHTDRYGNKAVAYDRLSILLLEVVKNLSKSGR